jgi:expansin (peptidoglycan-binding protein)
MSRLHFLILAICMLAVIALSACGQADIPVIVDGDESDGDKAESDLEQDTMDGDTESNDRSCDSGRISVFYVGRGESGLPQGLCGYGAVAARMPEIFRDGRVTAVNADFLNSNGLMAECGNCYRLSGPDGVQTVMVADSCPPECCETCQGDVPNFNLEPSVMDQLVTHYNDHSPVAFRQVPCPIDATIRLYVAGDAINPYWAEFMFYNATFSLAKVEVQATGPGVKQPNPWYELPISDHNTWVWSDALTDPDKPLFNGGTGVLFRLTSSPGEVLTPDISLNVLELGTDIDLEVQFSDQQTLQDNDRECGWKMPDGWIYRDGLMGLVKLVWADWGSFDLDPAVPDYTYTQNCHNSEKCIMVGRMLAYGGLQIGYPMAFPLGPFKSLEFWARSDETDRMLNKLAVRLIGYDENGMYAESNKVWTEPIATDWQHVTVDLSGITIPVRTQLILFLNDSNRQTPRLVLDDIRLLP